MNDDGVGQSDKDCLAPENKIKSEASSLIVLVIYKNIETSDQKKSNG